MIKITKLETEYLMDSVEMCREYLQELDDRCMKTYGLMDHLAASSEILRANYFNSCEEVSIPDE